MMPAPTHAAVWRFATWFVSAAICIGATLTPARGDTGGSDLIVHEWGTFTVLSDGKGGVVPWHRLSETDALPSFVHAIDCNVKRRDKRTAFSTVRMETPVLYFYADRPTKASVEVEFPGGIMTEWYPRAAVSDGHIRWDAITIRPDVDAELPYGDAANHYYAARCAEAATVFVDGDEAEHEGFLFYRGAGYPTLPLSATLEDEQVRAEAKDLHGQIIMFENEGGMARFRMRPIANGRASFDRSATGRPLEDLLTKLRSMLINEGLYEKEADAMIATWRQSWFEPGSRLFYILPRAATDRFLPIRIDPTPRQLVRVMVVRVEMITPQVERAFADHLRHLDAVDDAARKAAEAALRSRGRFTAPILTRMLNAENHQELRQRIQSFLQTY